MCGGFLFVCMCAARSLYAGLKGVLAIDGKRPISVLNFYASATGMVNISSRACARLWVRVCLLVRVCVCVCVCMCVCVRARASCACV